MTDITVGIAAAGQYQLQISGGTSAVSVGTPRPNRKIPMTIRTCEPRSEKRELDIGELDAASGGGARPSATSSSGIIKKRDELQMSIIRKM